jgi:hypothetical protein
MPCECVRADGLEEPDVSGDLTETLPIKLCARAQEIWEQNGSPSDGDVKFWLQAEAEIGERKRE